MPFLFRRDRLARFPASRPLPLRLEVLEDRNVPSTFTVTTTANSGAGSLRQAILDANATPSTNTIAFDVNGGGAQTIQPASALPTVTRPVTIDGTTQPGYRGVPLIVLRGSSAGGGASGLTITAGDTSVASLVIDGFSAWGVQLLTNGGDVLTSNYIGTDVSGTTAVGNGAGGVNVTGPDNTIGGPGAGNLISGNGGIGVNLSGSSGNVVAGNAVGTEVAGAAALRNSAPGIFVFGGSGNTIGGTAPGAGNLVSGNVYGIYLLGSNDNVVAGNYVGTDATGTRAVGNQLQGVEVNGVGNTIGGTGPGAGNLVSGNGGPGVFLSNAGTSANVIEGNTIGTDVGGTVSIPNLEGVHIDNGLFGNVIGGTDPGAGNLISGNQNYGVEILGSSTHDNVVQGNTIGTDSTGTRAVGSQFYGVYVTIGAHDNQIGGTDPGAGNLISGNVTFGVVLSTSGNRVQGNFIGTDGSGTAAVGNAIGVYVNGPNNTIGGSTAGAGNLISGNAQDGIYVASTSGTVIAGNQIGTDVSGTQPLANGYGGADATGVVLVDTTNTTVGGLAPGAGNLLSGNRQFGLYLGVSCSGTLVQGNTIGTDVTGTQALGNGMAGIYVAGAVNNLIGGTATGAGNLLSGNDGYGIEINANHSPGDTVQGNRIGTDASGTLPLGNAAAGVAILGGAGNLIGGTTAAAANVIAANGGSGVLIANGAATSNRVQGNQIGTDLSATIDLGNGADGVTVRNASGNVIGGTATGAGNTIAFNGNDGVLVDGGINDAVLSDLIFSSGNLGIELLHGGNTGLAAPQLTSATEDGLRTVVQGVLHGSANSTYTVQLFSDPSSDPNGQGEGQQLLGTYTVHTDASGVAHFTLVVDEVVPEGQIITATATDTFNNTSMFSDWVQVTLA